MMMTLILRVFGNKDFHAAEDSDVVVFWELVAFAHLGLEVKWSDKNAIGSEVSFRDIKFELRLFKVIGAVACYCMIKSVQ